MDRFLCLLRRESISLQVTCYSEVWLEISAFVLLGDNTIGVEFICLLRPFGWTWHWGETPDFWVVFPYLSRQIFIGGLGWTFVPNFPCLLTWRLITFPLSRSGFDGIEELETSGFLPLRWQRNFSTVLGLFLSPHLGSYRLCKGVNFD